MTPCPHCGEPVADDAVVCRHCGSDAETGWVDDVDYHSLELPDRDEEPRRRSLRPSGGVGTKIILLVILGGLLLAWVVPGALRTPVGKALLIAGAFLGTLFALREIRRRSEG
ncbi:MAG: zinc ribbon domain-containing protein [Planctomycetes bacterium]|nr:zinc ribbon domain-containing protein [Planctomycetota bacterium]